MLNKKKLGFKKFTQLDSNTAESAETDKNFCPVIVNVQSLSTSNSKYDSHELLSSPKCKVMNNSKIQVTSNMIPIQKQLPSSMLKTTSEIENNVGKSDNGSEDINILLKLPSNFPKKNVYIMVSDEKIVPPKSKNNFKKKIFSKNDFKLSKIQSTSVSTASKSSSISSTLQCSLISSNLQSSAISSIPTSKISETLNNEKNNSIKIGKGKSQKKLNSTLRIFPQKKLYEKTISDKNNLELKTSSDKSLSNTSFIFQENESSKASHSNAIYSMENNDPSDHISKSSSENNLNKDKTPTEQNLNRNSKPGMYKCDSCDFITILLPKIFAHFEKSHPEKKIIIPVDCEIEVPKISNHYGYRCVKCNFISTKPYMKLHIANHSNFVCEICLYNSNNINLIQEHNLNCNGHSCSFCCYSSFNLDNVKLHESSMHESQLLENHEVLDIE